MKPSSLALLLGLAATFREEAMTQATEETLPQRWVAPADRATVMLLIAERNRLPGFGLPEYTSGPPAHCRTG